MLLRLSRRMWISNMKRDSFIIEIEQGDEYPIGKNFPLGKKSNRNRC